VRNDLFYHRWSLFSTRAVLRGGIGRGEMGFGIREGGGVGFGLGLFVEMELAIPRAHGNGVLESLACTGEQSGITGF